MFSYQTERVGTLRYYARTSLDVFPPRPSTVGFRRVVGRVGVLLKRDGKPASLAISNA